MFQELAGSQGKNCVFPLILGIREHERKGRIPRGVGQSQQVRKGEWRGMNVPKVDYVLLLRCHNKAPYCIQLIYRTPYKEKWSFRIYLENLSEQTRSKYIDIIYKNKL